MSAPDKETVQWIFSVFVIPLLNALLFVVYMNVVDRVEKVELRLDSFQEKREERDLQMEARMSSVQGDVRYLTNMIRIDRQKEAEEN
jgi:hypothetical protein